MLRCIFCGFCQEVCPEEAIFLQKDYSLTGLSARRDDLQQGKTPRARRHGRRRPEMEKQIGRGEGTGNFSGEALIRNGSKSTTWSGRNAVPDVLFYVFAALTLLCGVLVIANPFSRNPVTSAMFLVLTIISMAGLFVLLHAFFLAAVQILVYAGAVIVLFLFVIMLLDLKEEQRRKINSSASPPA
jgi:Fe-S oxidoreductase